MLSLMNILSGLVELLVERVVAGLTTVVTSPDKEGCKAFMMDAFNIYIYIYIYAPTTQRSKLFHIIDERCEPTFASVLLLLDLEVSNVYALDICFTEIALSDPYIHLNLLVLEPLANRELFRLLFSEKFVKLIDYFHGVI